MGLLSAALAWSWRSLVPPSSMRRLPIFCGRLRSGTPHSSSTSGSVPETSPTLRWTGEVGDASVFRVWGARALVRDTSADKLSSRTLPCVFLGFPTDAPGWQFYHPASRTVLSSQDVTFDESVPFYRLFPYRTAPLPPPPLFLAPAEPVEVTSVSGAAGGGTARGAASGGAEPRRAVLEGEVPEGAEPVREVLEGAEPGGAEPTLGALSLRVLDRLLAGPLHQRSCESALRFVSDCGGVLELAVLQLVLETLVLPQALEVLVPGVLELPGPVVLGVLLEVLLELPVELVVLLLVLLGVLLELVELLDLLVVVLLALGVLELLELLEVLQELPVELGVLELLELLEVLLLALGGAKRPRPYFVPLLEQVLGLPPSPAPPPSLECPPPVLSPSELQPTSPLPAPSPYAGPTGGLTERREPASRPASPVRVARTGARGSRQRSPPVPGTHRMSLRPSTAPQRVPLPSPPESSLPALADPESDSLLAELVEFVARCRLDYAARLVAESESVCPPSVGGECALGTDVLEDRQEEFQCLAASSPHLVSMLLAPEGDPDALDIPTPRSYTEAVEGPYSSQWKAAMDAEMASWKSTGTYVDEVPPPGANIVSGMWIFRVKRPPGSLPVFKARYVARGFSKRQGVDYFQTFSPTPKMTTLRVLLQVAAQRDYELHSLDFSTAFLQGSLHEEIWLRRPPGFTGSFPPGTQWSLRRPVYGLRQAPRDWHNTLRTTLATLGFAPSTADASVFLRTDTSLPPFYILVYVDDLVFATADTEALTLVKSELQKRHTCTDLGELRSYLGLQITRDRARRTITLTQSHMVQQVLQRFNFQFSSPQSTPLPTGHSLSALPSDESVEPSGPYPELVGYLMYLMTCTRPDLAYPLSILARYVAPGRHLLEHWKAAKRVMRYLWSTSRMGLVLGGRGPVVLTGHADVSWVDDLSTQRSSQGYTFSLGSGSVSWRSTRSSSVLSSSCEAEIYAGAMAA
ncbi:unnamed protein product [Closterium sp. NIES-65]|nr:unnamed protein product [Closterium sp. NIES-65]